MSTEKLAHDLKVIAHDAEDLIKATAGDVSEKAREARSRLMAGVESAKASCARLQDQVQEKAIASAKATDKAIRSHPYESIGIAFGVGLLIGVLVCRGRGD
jgi:ElaB/YqjD/DUF883 family membrane-anchored ribosome-binding protein